MQGPTVHKTEHLLISNYCNLVEEEITLQSFEEERLLEAKKQGEQGESKKMMLKDLEDEELLELQPEGDSEIILQAVQEEQLLEQQAESSDVILHSVEEEKMVEQQTDVSFQSLEAEGLFEKNGEAEVELHAYDEDLLLEALAQQSDEMSEVSFNSHANIIS